MKKVYIAIDLKSFYASVECVDRELDPLTTNLVVADESRIEKTICLAVTPSLKAYGISGRARLFEVVQAVKEINQKRSTRHSAKACCRRMRTASIISHPSRLRRKRLRQTRPSSSPISLHRRA